MSEKIYVVTKGDYSDYHIITATTNEKHAKKIAKKFGAEVEIYDNSEIYTKNIFEINFDIKGNVTDCYKMTSEYDYPLNNEIRSYSFGIELEVEADNEQSAIKIAAEKRAKFLAEQQGL